MQSDTFDEVLGLEETFYEDGFRQGYEDGVKAGRIEGRTFGLEKGFEKYAESARLYGRSIVWANRLARLKDPRVEGSSNQAPIHARVTEGHAADKEAEPQEPSLPALPDNQRLAKHVRVLHALSESASLSTENTEEAVTDFDDRLKRAQGKAKIIERIIGDAKPDLAGAGVASSSGGEPGSMEDVGVPRLLG